jgi:hypothetical protein
MATTRTNSRPAKASTASEVRATAREVSGTVASAARRARGPALAAGGAAASLAGGLAIGSWMGARRSPALLPRRRRTVLGLRVGPRPSLVATAIAGAKQIGAATSKATGTAEDIRKIREHLEEANRRSPVEVLLDALTHRRGAHHSEQ